MIPSAKIDIARHAMPHIISDDQHARIYTYMHHDSRTEIILLYNTNNNGVCKVPTWQHAQYLSTWPLSNILTYTERNQLLLDTLNIVKQYHQHVC